MLDKLKQEIDVKIKDMDIFVDSILFEKEDGQKYLRIALDTKSDFIIDLNRVVDITNIINPIIDKEITEEEYVLDIYAKPKGDITNE